MGEMFPSGDSLARWLVTLALAMNDLTVVHVRLDEDQDNPELYWNRLAIFHFTEAALFLGESADIEQVSSFVDALPTAAREKYDECLAIFNERRGRLFSVREQGDVSLSSLRPDNAQAARPVGDALRDGNPLRCSGPKWRERLRRNVHERRPRGNHGNRQKLLHAGPQEGRV